MLTPIARRIVCISGFQQSITYPTGLERLWMKLRNVHTSGDCCVCLYPWNFNWNGLADHFMRTGPENPADLDIRIAAYSWGAGYGTLKFAQALRKRGMFIHYAVFSDPVYRSAWALWRSIWSPLIGRPIITIPKNIRNVWYVRQNLDIPSGHECVAEDLACTQIKDYGMMNCGHQWADEAHDFHNLAILAMLERGHVNKSDKPLPGHGQAGNGN